MLNNIHKWILRLLIQQIINKFKLEDIYITLTKVIKIMIIIIVKIVVEKI